MLNCRILFVNGPINSGKTTIAKLLMQQNANRVYLEGDELLSKTELTIQQWTTATVMTGTLKGCELAHEGKMAVIAFPLRDHDWTIIQGLCIYAGVKPLCITLDPGLETALSVRRERQLATEELNRIKEMYQEGYHQRSFSSLIINNGSETPEQTLQKIEQFLLQTAQPLDL